MRLLRLDEYDDSVMYQDVYAPRTSYVEQMHDFGAEAIVARRSQDNFDVLQLALQYRLSFALFQPKLEDIKDILAQALSGDLRDCGKILYLSSDNLKSWKKSDLLDQFAEQGMLMVGGNYEAEYMDMLEHSMHWGLVAD